MAGYSLKKGTSSLISSEDVLLFEFCGTPISGDFEVHVLHTAYHYFYRLGRGDCKRRVNYWMCFLLEMGFVLQYLQKIGFVVFQ